jgi:hypothetical protein
MTVAILSLNVHRGCALALSKTCNQCAAISWSKQLLKRRSFCLIINHLRVFSIRRERSSSRSRPAKPVTPPDPPTDPPLFPKPIESYPYLRFVAEDPTSPDGHRTVPFCKHRLHPDYWASRKGWPQGKTVRRAFVLAGPLFSWPFVRRYSITRSFSV